MRRFITSLLGFGSLQLALCLAIWQRCPRDRDHYAAAAIDKRERIEHAPSPRLVLVGGSAVSFGFDSRMLTAGTPYHPVNMGHDLEFGLAFMLAQTAANLRAGDLVVVAPEYPLLLEEMGDASIITLLEHDPKSARFLRAPVARRLCDQGTNWIARKLRCALHSAATEQELSYRRSSFDATGDFVGHRGRPPLAHAPLPASWAVATPDVSRALGELNRFARVCDHAGATCVFTFPPLRASHYAESQATLDAIAHQLDAKLELPILGRPPDAVYPDTEFFDAGWHLRAEAAVVHTQRVRALLESRIVGP